MVELIHKIYEIMNQIKGITAGYSAREQKMFFEYEGRLYVMECREIETNYTGAPKTIQDVAKKIKYL